MRIAVTGAAGFIGSNVVKGLNRAGAREVFAVDDLTDGRKFRNIVDAEIVDYLDWRTFYDQLEAGRLGSFDAIFHEGACSDTMESDGRYMMDANYGSSMRLLNYSQATGTRLLYASSAAVYGDGAVFVEEPQYERPLNVYGYSKLLFDRVVRQRGPFETQVAGFRYFNVYGPGEAHKGRMASVAFHNAQQIQTEGRVRLFGAYDGYAAGTQSRDFIHVADLVDVKLWFLEHPDRHGIFNLGTGHSQPFNDIAQAVINADRRLTGGNPLALSEMIDATLLEYVPFPEDLKSKYQSFTQADIGRLRSVGYLATFRDVAEGVGSYAEELLTRADRAVSASS